MVVDLTLDALLAYLLLRARDGFVGYGGGPDLVVSGLGSIFESEESLELLSELVVYFRVCIRMGIRMLSGLLVGTLGVLFDFTLIFKLVG